MQAVAKDAVACLSPLPGAGAARIRARPLPRCSPGALLKHDTDTPVVHVIRDPVDMVVSAYKYHLVTREKWAVR